MAIWFAQQESPVGQNDGWQVIQDSLQTLGEWGRLYSKNVQCTWDMRQLQHSLFLLEMQAFVLFDLLFCIRPDMFTIFN